MVLVHFDNADASEISSRPANLEKSITEKAEKHQVI